jgi:hypothetical protein
MTNYKKPLSIYDSYSVKKELESIFYYCKYLIELFIDTRYNYFLKILVFNRIFQKGIIKASS